MTPDRDGWHSYTPVLDAPTDPRPALIADRKARVLQLNRAEAGGEDIAALTDAFRAADEEFAAVLRWLGPITLGGVRYEDVETGFGLHTVGVTPIGAGWRNAPEEMP